MDLEGVGGSGDMRFTQFTLFLKRSLKCFLNIINPSSGLKSMR